MSRRPPPNAPPQYVRDTTGGNDLDAVTAEDFDAGELARDSLNRRKPRRGNKRTTARGHHGALPHELQQLLGESNIAYMEKRYPEALAACHAVITKLPSCGEAFALMGLIYEETGDSVRCADSYRLACAASPNDSAMWLRFARISRVVGRQTDARDALVRASKLAPEDLDLGMEAASLCVEAGEVSRATFIYKRVLQHPRNTNPIPILLTLADLQLEAGNVAGLKDSLVDSVNWCMGIPLESMQAAVLDEKEGARECEEEEEEEEEEEDGEQREQPLVSSRFRVGDHLLCPRPELKDSALNSANMLVQILNLQKEFKAATRVVERTHSYLAHLDHKRPQASKASTASASVSTRVSVLAALALLPLELVVRYGIAQVWLDDSLNAAGACFSQLWSVPPASAPELYAEVGVALTETGKFGAALGVLAKLVQKGKDSKDSSGGGTKNEASLLLSPSLPSYTSGEWEGVCNFSSAFDAWEPGKWLLPLPGAPSLGSEDGRAGADAAGEDEGTSSPPYFNSDHTLFPLSITRHFKKPRPCPSPLFKVFTSLAMCHESLGLEKEGGSGDENVHSLDSPLSSSRQHAALVCLLAAVHVQPDLGVSLTPRLFTLLCRSKHYSEAFGLISSHTLTSRAHEDDIAVLLQGAMHYFNTLEGDVVSSWSFKCGLLEASLGMGLPQCSLYARIKRLSGSLDYYGGGVEGFERFLVSFKECIAGAEDEGCERVQRFVFNLYSLVERVIERDHYAAKAQRGAILDAIKDLNLPEAVEGGTKNKNGTLRPPKILVDLYSSASAPIFPGSEGDESRKRRGRPEEVKGGGVFRRKKGAVKRITEESDFWGDCSDTEMMDADAGDEAGGESEETNSKCSLSKLATLQRLAATMKSVLRDENNSESLLVDGLDPITVTSKDLDVIYDAASGRMIGFNGDTLPPSVSTETLSTPLDFIRGAASKAAAASKSLSDLTLALRKLAQGYPYDIGVWSLYRLVEARSQWASLEVKSLSAAAAASVDDRSACNGIETKLPLPPILGAFTSTVTNTSFRRAILRSHLLHTSSAPLLLLAASESMHSRSSFRYAMGAFTEVTRQHPHEAMTHLGSGAAFLNAAFSRSTLNKHTHAVRGLFSISRGILSDDKRDSLKEGFSGDLYPVPSSAAPYHIPLSLKAAEKSFNSGRAAHQLGFLDLAIQFYSDTLGLIDKVAPLVDFQRINTPGGEVSGVVAGGGGDGIEEGNCFQSCPFAEGSGRCTQGSGINFEVSIV